MERLRVRELHRRENLRLHAVESIHIQHTVSDNGCRLFARLEPSAVVVRDPHSVRAFDMAGKEISFPSLRALAPELVEVAD